MDTPRLHRSLPTRRLVLSVSVLCAAALAVPAQAAAYGPPDARANIGPLGAPVVVSAPGFDTCAAPNVHDMATWRASSPYQAMGVYVGGANRACPLGNLTPGWVHTVAGQGWNLVPIYVGRQAPCVKEKKMKLMSGADPVGQGVAAADDAVSAAGALDLAPGSPIYFDLEAFNENDPGCVHTVTAFLDSWTAHLHARGYLSGVYGSADSGMATLVGVMLGRPGFVPPDAIWIAHWDRQARTGDESVPDKLWIYHQRIKQYQGGHPEKHGGVSLNIDSDWLDGPVAQIAS